MMEIIETIKMFFTWLQEAPPALLVIICGAVMTLTMINGGLILPLIFNLKVIPEIEKKVGQKLEYWSWWKNYIVFWKFSCPHLEVSQYIFFQYLTKKTKINFAKLINRDYALKKVNYDIRRASRFELVMSFIAAINFCLTFISVVIGLLIAHYYNIH